MFLNRIAKVYGVAWVKQRLSQWRWSLSTAFTGVGCAENAALSIQATAQRFAPGCGVTITSACEIDRACQKVLKATFDDDQCIFPDIRQMNTKNKYCFCSRHNQMCELQPDPDKDCPVCVDYSLMGRRLQETGPSHEVHVSYYANMRNSKNSVLIIENVTEYKEALVKRELGGQWDLCLRSQVTMNAGAYFFKDLPKAKLTPSAAPLCGTGAHNRYLEPDEALSSHVLPVTKKQARDSGSIMLQLGDVARTSQVKMAGNAMSVPCIGAVMMCAALGLQKIPQK
ncbi:unnamed protein product [Durusdinium trenchii]|uniref:Uncharacterized protein n=1 Tax=Durusdinium trenchii TaxID=1381693 RepID=A0ABP0QNK2_9DINO